MNILSFTYKTRNTLIFAEPSFDITANDLVDFYLELVRKGIPPRDEMHRFFISLCFQRIQEKYPTKDLTALFIAITDFDTLYRNEVAYIGSVSKIASKFAKILLSRASAFTETAEALGVYIHQELDVTATAIDKILLNADAIPAEKRDDLAMTRHYLLGTTSKYSKGTHISFCEHVLKGK